MLDNAGEEVLGDELDFFAVAVERIDCRSAIAVVPPTTERDSGAGIDHGFGIQTVYGHNSQVFVQAGEKVSQGTQVAMVGRTGRATGPHLHYEVRVDGVPVDPLNFIDDILE